MATRVVLFLFACVIFHATLAASLAAATTADTQNARSNCSTPCSSAELAHILTRISANPVQLFGLAASSSPAGAHEKKQPADASTTMIRAKCVKQLLATIRELASGELEMKSLLEFASSTLPLNRRLDLSSLRALHVGERREARIRSACDANKATEAEQQELQLLGDDAPGGAIGGLATADETKSKFLHKFVANIDHWIDTLERFTLTREWSALLKVFRGSETIMGMFVKPSGASKPSKEETGQLMAKLERDLPVEVQTLASSLNQLLPWHVWPWNNVDLHATIDTFLNHGIFAFSKTTSGPERRIDYLSLMLERLFRSLKHESFPKKCLDWSRIICDLDSFHDRLVLLSPQAGQASSDEPQEVAAAAVANATLVRQEQVRQLSAVNDNKLTQELTCIMFSSLSMQQFGAKDNVDFKQMFESGNETLATGAQLHWDKQVRKAMRLYRLSREALSDEQWRALYNQAQEAWSKTKISERVIMLGRIVQLLTNCHMPREILESALWKDIYKYKNALNQLVDVVIDELNRSSENGKFTIEQLAIGSKQLEQILERFLRLLPRLIESISRTLVDGLPELVNKFFNEKIAYLKGPCKGYSFAQLIPSMAEYRHELVELELLVCRQLRIKPSITMAQINNLTNEFLAMVFSGNFSGSLAHSLPLKFWAAPISGAIQKVPSTGGALALRPAHHLSKRDDSQTRAEGLLQHQPGASSSGAANVTSIIDELALNPQLAQIVAILQSSALDPPEVHAGLPELDWVEAGTSVALLYESIQRLISFEGTFSVFPELADFQAELVRRAETSKQLFKRFARRDTVQLVAYALDTAMPVALRSFSPMDTFHRECLSTFRDIFGDVASFEASAAAQSSAGGGAPNVTPSESRQFQCAVSSANFVSFALNNLIRTFNIMLKSIMDQMSHQQQQQQHAQQPLQSLSAIKHGANYCVLFDGSITTLMDNLAHIVDLAFETVLIASTNANTNTSLTLKETLCARYNELDPFGDQLQLLRQQKLRHAICHLLHESSLATCGDALKVNEWTQTMRELNVTWFESAALSVEPSFRGILHGVDQFLELFAKVKPSSMSDGLIARVLNFSSYWSTLVTKAASSFEKYREKRFELALQVLVPILGDPSLWTNHTAASRSSSGAKETSPRRTLELSVLSAKSVLDYFAKEETSPASGSLAIETQLKTLFDWADRYSLAVAETLLRTAASNVTKLERLVAESGDNVWDKFCLATVDTYLEFEQLARSDDNCCTHNKATLPAQARLVDVSAAKEQICAQNWTKFESDLLALSNASTLFKLELYSDKQLVRVALTKWGQVLDLILESGTKRAQRLSKFLTLQHWQALQEKLPSITPIRDEPTNFSWIWSALERLVLARDTAATSGSLANVTSAYDALLHTFDQLNCALDSVKGGITWDNIANIYQDRQDILAAHSTLNNGITLASAGANTFLAHKKFQKFLNDFVKPKTGLAAFCEMRDKAQLETIFVAPDYRRELPAALESFQEFVCDTTLETLVQNLNPIAYCYQPPQATTTAWGANTTGGALSDSIDRFFKLSSLAILDAKLVETIDAKPLIFDKTQWDRLRVWWLNQTEVHQGNSGLALTLVRIFQTLDSINSEHVVWRAIFRSIYELSEVSAYLLRATELERNEEQLAANYQKQQNVPATKLSAQNQHNTMLAGTAGIAHGLGQQRLASTLTNVMFPESNNFISFRTFKQLRYLKSITDYFAANHQAQEWLCNNLTSSNRLIRQQSSSSSSPNDKSKFELIDYQLDSSEKLFSLLCHYHSTQWLTAMNIVLSKKTASLSKKTNYMTKYLSMFTRNFKDNENLQSFIHGQQLENIEAVANTTVVYLIALSKPFRTLEMSKISNMSWHSLPSLLDQIDSHLCLSKFDGNTSAYQLIVYEPKKPNIETILCKLPSWNITQVYDYFSENIDLQNVISLVKQNNRTAAMFGITLGAANNAGTQTQLASSTTKSNVTVISLEQAQNDQPKTCMTPFKFASKWLKIVQDLIDEIMSKGNRERLHKCFNANRKNQSIYLQTLRFLKSFNNALTTLNDFTVNNSWHYVRRSWNSISFALLNQTGSTQTPGHQQLEREKKAM